MNSELRTVGIPLVDRSATVVPMIEENINSNQETKWGMLCRLIKTPAGKIVCGIGGVLAIGVIGYGISLISRSISLITTSNSTNLINLNQSFDSPNGAINISSNPTRFQEYTIEGGFTKPPVYNYTGGVTSDFSNEQLNTTNPYSDSVLSRARINSEKISIEALYDVLKYLESISSNETDYSKCGGLEHILKTIESCKSFKTESSGNYGNASDYDYDIDLLETHDNVVTLGKHQSDLLTLSNEEKSPNMDYESELDDIYQFEYVDEDQICSDLVSTDGLQDFLSKNGSQINNRYFLTKGYDDSVVYIKSMLENNSLPFFSQEVQFYCDIPNCKTQNLFTYIPGDSDEVITIGAHLDSVFEGKGINDNGSGVAALLEIARVMKESSIELKHPILFAWWGVEEIDLQGSEYFVNSLSVSDNILKNITGLESPSVSCYLNMDMLGSKNGMFFINQAGAPDIRTNHRHIYSPDGSDYLSKLLNESLVNMGLYTEGSELLANSDHSAFAGRNIPVAFLFTGAGSNKTKEQALKAGGIANQPYDTCYHQACDDINNIDMDMLYNATKAMTQLLTRLAMSTDIWT